MNQPLLSKTAETKSSAHWLFFAITMSVIITFNWLFLSLIQAVNVPIITNDFPLGLPLTLWGQILVVAFVCAGFFILELYGSYPLVTALILAGAFSNLLERMILGGVRDYIPLPTGYANVADFELWIGLIILNIQIWTPSFYAIIKPKSAINLKRIKKSSIYKT